MRAEAIGTIQGGRGYASDLLWALVVIGYPAVALFGTVLNVDSATVSMPFRAFVAMLSLGLMVRGILSGRRLGVHPLLVAFFALYAGRLLWDWLVVGVPRADTALVFFIGVVLLPTLALVQTGAPAVETRLAVLIALIGAVVCVGAVFAHLYGGLEEKALAGETGRLSYEALNPISMGHAAATTIIAACALLYVKKGRALLFTIPLIAVATACIFFAASRGPLVALSVALLVLALAARGGLVLIAVAIAVGVAFQGELLESETEFAARIAGVGEDSTSVERLWLQASALEQFAEEPILGSSYIESESGTYPHNVFVEVLMATGLLGALLFIGVLLRGLQEMRRQLRAGRALVAILFVQFLIGFQFSGAIWGSAAFWGTLGVLARVRGKRRKDGSGRLAQKSLQLA